MGSPGDGTVTGRVLGSATLEFPDSSPDSDGPEVRAGVREGPTEGSQDEERTGAYGVGAGWVERDELRWVKREVLSS